MITPTLFVGLGTTGTNILKRLRELMSEEYGHAGLPLFRYIAIETDGGVEADNTNQMRDYERINLITATIASVSPIRHRLNPGDPLHNPHLAEWLNPDLLKIEAGGFTAGASNIRMAGRLCLWENWTEVRNTLNTARATIIAPATTRETENILTAQSKIEEQPVDKNGIKIYVVGSLCGGSCGGMLLDVAYYLRRILTGQGDMSKIYGMFTMFDENHAAKPDAMCDIRAANCYASLLELNYYHHKDSTYTMTFPDDLNIRTGENPFDYTLFISPTGKTPSNQFLTPNGDFDEHGLNLMVALNLFAESAADTGGKKGAIRTDFTSHTDFGSLKPVQKGGISTMARYMASFGLTAVWYPKYRIATAAGCLRSKELCDNWLKSHISQATTIKDAGTEWQRILRENIDSLTSPDADQPIKSRIGAHLKRAKQQWLNTDNSPDQLKQKMEAFPIKDSFKEKFEPGGEYFQLMKMQTPVCKKAFDEAISKVRDRLLEQIDFGGKYGLEDVRVFFEAFEKEIDKTIQDCPGQMPSLDIINSLDFDPMIKAYNNPWLKMFFLHKKRVAEHRSELVNQYCNLIDGKRTSFYVLVRNHLLRSILQEIRDEHRAIIKRQLDQITGNLRNCEQQLDEKYEHAIDPPISECVKIVANNPDNRIDTDAIALGREITNVDDGIKLLSGESMAKFLAKEQDEIANRMIETYRQLSLNQIQVNDVVVKAHELLDSGSPDIPNLASRSNPYQMFTSIYIPFAIASSPNIIFGQPGNPLTKLNTNLGGQGHQFRIEDSSVDHLLFFYQEEAGFALDDLVSHEMLSKKFRKAPGEYGHSTHQDADFYNLELHYKKEKLERWSQVLGRLVPEICNRIDPEIFDSVFQLEHGKYVYEYKIDGATKWLVLQDQMGIQELAMSQNDGAYQTFLDSVRSRLQRIDRTQIDETIITPLLRVIQDVNTRNQVSGRYKRFLDEVYAEGTTVVDQPPGKEAAVIEHFSEISSDTEDRTPSLASDIPSNVDKTNPVIDETAGSSDYDEVMSEETVHGGVAQKAMTGGSEVYKESVESEEGAPSSENGSTSNETSEDEYVWTDAETDTEPSLTDDTTSEQGEPETDTKTDPGFSVADSNNVKQASRRGGPRKRE